jgi:hypothetical protein
LIYSRSKFKILFELRKFLSTFTNIILWTCNELLNCNWVQREMFTKNSFCFLWHPTYNNSLCPILTGDLKALVINIFPFTFRLYCLEWNCLLSLLFLLNLDDWMPATFYCK